MSFERVAMIWNRAVPERLQDGAHIGTLPLAALCGLSAIWWGNTETPTRSGLSGFDIFIVNLFAGMPHVQQIKALRPDALVVVRPDDCMDDVFAAADMRLQTSFLEAIRAADAIATVSHSNADFYSIFDKPMVHIPTPIGTDRFFAQVRKYPRRDYLLAADHSMKKGSSMPTVAALARVQKATGRPVVYVNATPETKVYAEALGLEADYLPYMVYQDFVELAAKAAIGIDLYTRYGVGRNELTFMYAGTPVIGSTYTNFGQFDPWAQIEQAADYAIELLDNPKRFEQRQAHDQFAVKPHSFMGSLITMKHTVERLREWHLQSSSLPISEPI